jgi:hypothetical protein
MKLNVGQKLNSCSVKVKKLAGIFARWYVINWPALFLYDNFSGNMVFSQKDVDLALSRDDVG